MRETQVPFLGKTPPAVEQLSPRTTAADPVPWSLRDTQSAPVSSPREVGGRVREKGDLGQSDRGWRQGSCQGAENAGGFLRTPRHPSCPGQMRRGGRGCPPRVQPPSTPHPGSSGTPPFPRAPPLLWALRSAGPDLYRTTATRWQMQGSQPSAWRTHPRVLCLQDVKSKQDGGQACGEQGKVTGARAPRPACRCGTRLEGRTVAQQEVLMGKVGKKLPTAMETSRKTRVPAGKQSGPVTMPSSLVSGWASRTGPKGPPSTPRGAPRFHHADLHQGRPGDPPPQPCPSVQPHLGDSARAPGAHTGSELGCSASLPMSPTC